MYLERLTLRLAAGLEHADSRWRTQQVEYLRRAQRGDGGFAGREGASDLYYTAFGVRALALLAALDGEPAARACGYLQSRLTGQTPIVDFLSLIYAARTLELAAGVDVFAGQPETWQTGVASALESLRREDGGYAKTSEGAASSVYHSFLVVLCQQLIGQSTPQAERLVDFIRARRRPDGGFVEMNVMKRSGTNPTAAAIGVLGICDAVDDDTRDGAVEFLLDAQADEGGMRANTRIPIADLLSTFTGLLTLADLGALEEADLSAARRLVDSLQLPQGGFHGAAWDTGDDVEYTFYGIATQSLLARPQALASHG
jgi:geranylgeranyl transferase type-2 subunit beta